MPLPPHLQVALRWQSEEASATCVLFYSIGGVDTLQQEELVTIADELYAALRPPALLCTTPNVTVPGLTIKLVGHANELEQTNTDPSGAVGAVAGEHLPENNAVVLQRRTGKSGRSNRGRVFIPFVPEAHANDSALTPAAVAVFGGLGAAMFAKRTIAGRVLTAVHAARKLNVLQPITACNVVSHTCSRRDRYSPKQKGKTAVEVVEVPE